MRWLGLMPLRGGSKSIPGKNLRVVAGRPLFAWALEQALRSAVFDALVVATDSGEIAAAVRQEFGTAVTVSNRSPESASDTAPSELVLAEASARFGGQVLGLIQATSPLTAAADFRRARSMLLDGGYDSIVTAVPSRRFYWSKAGIPLNYDPRRRPRRQDFAGCLVENGAFYLVRRALFEATGCRLCGRIGVLEMSEQTLVEVDEPLDLERVATALLRRSRVAAGAGEASADVAGRSTAS